MSMQLPDVKKLLEQKKFRILGAAIITVAAIAIGVSTFFLTQDLNIFRREKPSPIPVVKASANNLSQRVLGTQAYRFVGRITAIDDDQLTVQPTTDGSAAVTVRVTDATRLTIRDISKPSLPNAGNGALSAAALTDLRTTQTVYVEAASEPDEDNELTALEIMGLVTPRIK